MADKKTKKCYNCTGEEFETIHKGVRDNQSIDVLRCKNCGLVCLNDDSHIDTKFYEQGKMLGEKVNLENWINNTKDDDLRRFQAYKNELKNKIAADFGCGNAGFLNLAKTVCKKVYGVELQKDFYEYFKECGLDVFPDAGEIPQKADTITLFHVLEHIKDPTELLKNLKTPLKPDGKIIIEVPNSNDALISFYNCTSFQDFVFWSCHIYVYNEKALKQIVKNAGYTIKKFSYIQRYSLMNHLFWLLKNKPGGHKKWAGFDLKPLNCLYSFILKLFKATDTMIVEITPK